MPSWLGMALAAAFGLVTLHRGAHRDAPSALMAAGMAVMSLGMAGIGPDLVHGPWWAAGFAALALWPVVRRVPVCGGRVTHLLGGLAMVYMCAMPGHGSPSTPAGLVTVTGHHHGPHAGPTAVALPGAASSLSGPLGTALALLGWALACYFLLGTVSVLTRRDPSGRLTTRRASVLGEAAMALGTVVLLVALTESP